MNSLRCLTLLAVLLGAGCQDRTPPPAAQLAPASPLDGLDPAKVPDDMRGLLAMPELVGFVRGHTRAVATIAFSPDGRQLASASWDNTVKLWDLTRDEPKEVASFAGSPSGIAYLQGGKLVATGSTEARVVVWDISAKPTVRWTLSGHKYRPFALTAAPGGKMLASGSLGPVLRLWKLDGDEPEIWAALANETAPSLGVSSLSFSGDGKLLAAGSHLGKQTLRVWDVSGDVLEERTIPAAQARIVQFSLTERLLAFAGDDAAIHLWSFAAAEPQKRQVLEGHKKAGLPPAVKALAFAPDGKTLASGGQDRQLILWRMDRGEPRHAWELPGEVRALAFAPDGRYLAVGGDDGALIILRTKL